MKKKKKKSALGDPRQFPSGWTALQPAWGDLLTHRAAQLNASYYLDLASIYFSACDFNDFGTPSQPFPLPWLPSRSCKPGSFISYLQELGSHRAWCS